MTDTERWPERLAAIAIDLDNLFRGNPYLKHLGAEIDDWGLGWARTKLTPGDDSGNIVGTTHGGIVVGLADAAFETACNSYGRQCVAIELSTHFVAASEIGTPLVAEATEVSRSRRLGSYRVEVSDESKHTIVATVLALAYRTDDWHLGADRYPPDWRARY
jgi:acyl-CoA thioesterase